MKETKNGKVYTPVSIAKQMAKMLQITNQKTVIGKRMLDPACGDGRLLSEVVKLVLTCIPTDTALLKDVLGEIHGWDTDPVAIEKCKSNLSKLVPSGITIDWKIEVKDALKLANEPKSFDYIIANPPYIRTQDLTPDYRNFLKKNYTFCQRGAGDLYLAFFERAYNLLKPQGKAVFIAPNSWLSSKAATQMKSFFLERQAIEEVFNFKSSNVFKNVSTYVAIVNFSKLAPRKDFIYQEITKDGIAKSTLLYDKKRRSFMPESIQNGIKLGDVAQIFCGLATLSDQVFILNVEKEEEKFIWVQSKASRETFKLEKAITRPIIKASIFNKKGDIGQRVVFPYSIDSCGKHKLIPEEVLKQRFPFAYAYLCHHRQLLISRDKGKPNPVAWYAFGRSQGIDSGFGKKILFSPIIKEPSFKLFNKEDYTFYGGYAIKYDGDYNALLEALNSKEMANFIALNCPDKRGGYKGLTKNILENFILPE